MEIPEMRDLKPTVLSALTVTLIVVITIPLLKYALNRWQVPGLTDLVNSV